VEPSIESIHLNDFSLTTASFTIIIHKKNVLEVSFSTYHKQDSLNLVLHKYKEA